MIVIFYLLLQVLCQIAKWALLSDSCLEKVLDFGMQLSQLPGLLLLLVPKDFYCLLLRCLRLLKLRNISLQCYLMRGRVIMGEVIGMT